MNDRQANTHQYDNVVYQDNVYEHVLTLIRRHVRTIATDRDNLIHLDIGCGFGRIAEYITAEFGLQYVGVDGDQVGLSALKDRGFEAHQVWMSDFAGTMRGFEEAIGARKIAFITMLDTLEHLVEGDAILLAIQALAHRHNAIFVMSVPNVAHRDLGLKLAFGRWDYTKAGLLDHTHVRLFTNDGLKRVTNAVGLYEVDGEDVTLVTSDQHFPRTHPALAEGSLLTSYLRRLRDGVDPYATVNQFVRAYVAGPRNNIERYAYPEDKGTPFLSVVTRTQGRRLHTLKEVLVSLAGQTDRDFELIVVGHKLDPQKQLLIERMVEDNPEWLRDRTRFLRVDDGNRTRPLNVGFEDARGEYIVILDDDDLPFAHWVETFHATAQQQPGRLLRSVAVRQTVTDVQINGWKGLRAISGLEMLYPKEFDLFRHFHMNETPPVSVAFPRGVFHDLHIRFDENLTTTEDWDYILRASLCVGVASSPEITAIYRWWDSGESSRAVHSPSEWKLNHELIWHKLNMAPMLLPAGSFSAIRSLVENNEKLIANEQNSQRPRDLAETQPDHAHLQARQTEVLRLQKLEHLINLMTSASWMIALPLRCLGYLFGRPRPRVGEFVWASLTDLDNQIVAIKSSTSWRATSAYRVLVGFLRSKS